ASLLQACDLPVVADTGPEAITGSTRLKAGTATKVLLNSFSSALMIKAGRTYSNLMVGLVATNDKLRDRSVALLVEASGQPQEHCTAALEEAGGGVEAALVSLLADTSAEQARRALAEHGGVRAAVAAGEEGWAALRSWPVPTSAAAGCVSSYDTANTRPVPRTRPRCRVPAEESTSRTWCHA